MLTRLIAIILGVAAVAVLNAIISQPRSGEIVQTQITAPVAASSPGNSKTLCEPPKSKTPARDVIAAFQQSTRGDYLIQTRHRVANLGARKPIDVSYLTIEQKDKVIAKFDTGIYSPAGNLTHAGFFPLLGNQSEQLVISQDASRTGMQWVVDFSTGFRTIFDGQKFQVGRESADMTISDLDGDGISEIIVPFTAFYGFEGWRLTAGDTPLPDIIFRYDPAQREYLPANTFFKQCIFPDTQAAEKSLREIEEPHLARLMSIVLDYVFIGEEQHAWKLFDEACDQQDKARIRSDMEKVLKAHPVYRYIYKRTANR